MYIEKYWVTGNSAFLLMISTIVFRFEKPYNVEGISKILAGMLEGRLCMNIRNRDKFQEKKIGENMYFCFSYVSTFDLCLHHRYTPLLH